MAGHRHGCNRTPSLVSNNPFLDFDASDIFRDSWNSAIFASIPFAVFPAAVVSSDFLTSPDDWSVSYNITSQHIYDQRSLIYELHSAGRNFTHLNTTECIQRYIDPLNATSDLILVSESTAAEANGSSLLYGWISGGNAVLWNRATAWVCVGHKGVNKNTYCSAVDDEISQYADNWTIPMEHGFSPPIQYCLVGPSGNNQERCGFHYSVVVLILVCICTSIESVIVTWTARRHSSPTMVTTGDAIAEFLKEPEHGNEALPSPDLTDETEDQSPKTTKLVWGSDSPVRWFHAASLQTWIVSLSLYVPPSPPPSPHIIR